MSPRAFWLSLAVAAFAAGSSAAVADSPAAVEGKKSSSWLGSLAELPPGDDHAGGRDLVIEAPSGRIRVRVVTLVDGNSVDERRKAALADWIRKADGDGDGKISGKEYADA